MAATDGPQAANDPVVSIARWKHAKRTDADVTDYASELPRVSGTGTDSQSPPVWTKGWKAFLDESISKEEDRKQLTDEVIVLPKEYKNERIGEMMSTTLRAMLQGAVTQDMVEALQ